MPPLKTITVLVSASALALALAPATALANGKLSVPLIGQGGASAGTVDLTDTPNGVLVEFTVPAGGLEPGERAMHFHETGDCSDQAAFQSAGGHYNPADAEHGFIPEGGPHAGDMPNIVILDGAETKLSVFNPMIRLSEGDAPLLDGDGSALVIHAGTDDYRSQPSGNAGDRIACAEIKGS